MTTSAAAVSTFEVGDAGRTRVTGLLSFATVSNLLPLGTAAIREGQASVIDLAGVTGSDSSGLALLIEWLSIAGEAKQAVRYENIPVQLEQLARLSEVDELLSGVSGGGADAVGAGTA